MFEVKVDKAGKVGKAGLLLTGATAASSARENSSAPCDPGSLVYSQLIFGRVGAR